MDLDTVVAILGIVGFAMSEVLALNPKWKSNSVLQLIATVLKNAKSLKKP